MRSRAKSLLIGTGPDVRSWERDWVAFRPLKAELYRAISRPSSVIVHAANAPTACGVWLADRAANRSSLVFQGRRIAELSATGRVDLPSEVDLCLIEARQVETARLGAVLHAALPALRPGGRIAVSVEFRHSEVEYLATLGQPEMVIVSTHFVSQHALQHAAQGLLRRMYHLTMSQPWFGLPLAVTTGPFALCAAALANVAAARRASRPRDLTTCSQYVLVLEKTDRANWSPVAGAAGGYAPVRSEGVAVHRPPP